MKRYTSRADRASCELFYDQQQWDSLREELQSTANRAAIEEVTGVHDSLLLEAIAELDVDLETIAMIAIVPMMRVAWASGQVEYDERELLLRELHGGADVEPHSVARPLLEQYLRRAPTDIIFQAWSRCAVELLSCLEPEMRQAFSQHIVTVCENVAKSAGGFLGLGRICNNEVEAIEQIRQTLDIPLDSMDPARD